MTNAVLEQSRPMMLSSFGPVIVGKDLPAHLQRAWGRHIFRLLHGGRDCGLFLRDLPLDMVTLGREYGFTGAIGAYYLECVRTRKAPQIP